MDAKEIDKRWLEKYNIAKEYYETYGNLDVKTEQIFKGLKLGEWLSIQRYRNKISKSNRSWSKISQEEINLLNEIGFNWERNKLYNDKWEEYYKIAKKYFEEFNHLNIPSNEVYYNINLGFWIRRQRDDFSKNKMTEERIQKLNQINMIWNLLDYEWTLNYSKAKEYFDKNKNLNIPKRYVVDEIKLGAWIQRQRTLYKTNKLSKDKKIKLTEIGMIWECNNNSKQTSFPEIATYFYIRKYFPDAIHRKKINNKEFDIYIHSLKIAIEYDGNRFHKLKRKKEIDLNKNKLCKNENINLIRIREFPLEKINETDFILNEKNNNLEEAIEYILKLILKDNIKVNVNKDSLEIYTLMEISDSWNKMYKEAKEYYTKNKTMIIPQNTIEYKTLLNWKYTQRKEYKKNKLSREQIELLKEIDILK